MLKVDPQRFHIGGETSGSVEQTSVEQIVELDSQRVRYLDGPLLSIQIAGDILRQLSCFVSWHPAPFPRRGAGAVARAAEANPTFHGLCLESFGQGFSVASQKSIQKTECLKQLVIIGA